MKNSGHRNRGLSPAVLLSFLAVFLLTPLSHSADIDWNSSYEEALQKSEATGKPVFLDLYADWCGPCKQMEKEIFPLEKVSSFISGKFIPLRLNVDENQEIARKYQVMSIPTLLVLEKDGQPSGRLVGMLPAEQMLKELEDILGVRQEYIRLEKETSQNPENAKSHYQLGQAAWRLDRYDAATRQLEKAIELDPAGEEIGLGTASIMLARTYGAKGDVEPAIKMLESYLEKHPDSAHEYEARFFLGVLHLDNRQVEQAKEYLQAALKAPEGRLEKQIRDDAEYILSQVP